jgi:glucan phosphoethanolaminetransferase (alkaline phosphatase superfamily)
MFHTDITFTLALIALVLAAYLVLLAKVHTDVSAIPCTLIGYAVVVIALIVLLFSGFFMVNKTMIGYEMHTQMMSEMMPMHLQRERMLKIREAQQMPMHSMSQVATEDEHGKKPLKATIRKP